MRQELGVEPEQETRDLRNSIESGQIVSGERMMMADVESDSSPITGRENSILVLPFDNLSGDPHQDYFSDGITESIILNLSLFKGLSVKSRHSSFAFKDSMEPIREISEQLDVQYMVEGSIRKSRNKIRITAQLIEPKSGNQLWGKRYDRDIEDLFDLEQEIESNHCGHHKRTRRPGKSTPGDAKTGKKSAEL